MEEDKIDFKKIIESIETLAEDHAGVFMLFCCAAAMVIFLPIGIWALGLRIYYIGIPACIICAGLVMIGAVNWLDN